jgi:hypothetical protein
MAMTDEAPKVVPFGKYKGRLIDEVLVDDPNYLLVGDDSESIVLNLMQPQRRRTAACWLWWGGTAQ